MNKPEDDRFALDEPFVFPQGNKTGKRKGATYDDPAEGRKTGNANLTGYGRTKRETVIQASLEVAKQDYITSEKCPNIRKLASTVGVSESCVRTTMKKENWAALRNEFHKSLLGELENELKIKIKKHKQALLDKVADTYSPDRVLPLVDAMYNAALDGNVAAFKAFLDLFSIYDKTNVEGPKIAIQNNIDLGKLEEIAKKSGFIKD